MVVKLVRVQTHSDYYYVIYADDVRAGFVEITASAPHKLNIKINKPMRGRGIGSAAYRKACQKSRLDHVYAHIAKKNVASQRAAERAGFKLISDTPQLTYRWDKVA